MKVAQSCLTLCDPTDYSLLGCSVHGGSLGKNTGVGSFSLLQGIFPIQGTNPHLHWQVDSLPLSHQGRPLKKLHKPSGIIWNSAVLEELHHTAALDKDRTAWKYSWVSQVSHLRDTIQTTVGKEGKEQGHCSTSKIVIRNQRLHFCFHMPALSTSLNYNF